MNNINQQTEYFLLVVNAELVNYNKKNININTYNFDYIITPQHVEDNKITEGITMYGCSHISNELLLPTIHTGINGKYIGKPKNLSMYRKPKYPGVWQFVTFNETNGIYLYSPIFDKIVSKDSLYLPSQWILTDEVEDGFDFTEYLCNDVFDEDYVESEITYKNHDTERNSIWLYKEFNKTNKSTVLVYPTDTYKDPDYNKLQDINNIEYFLSDNNGNNQWILGMLLPLDNTLHEEITNEDKFTFAIKKNNYYNICI